MSFLRQLADQAEGTAIDISHHLTARLAPEVARYQRCLQRLGNGDHWHDIRAGFITHVAITSGGVAAQSLARHADFSTTLNYIHVADEVKRAGAKRAARRPALKDIPPKSPIRAKIDVFGNRARH